MGVLKRGFTTNARSWEESIYYGLILEVFGPDTGAHTRSAVGMAELPFSVPVEIEAELLLKSSS